MMLRGRGEASLSEEQLRALGIVTRTASAMSALGVVAIIVTFSLSRHFRNPMHRLIFINAFYNAFDVVCTMISISGPKAGQTSPLCQFQAFLNQMFPVADVLWTLFMAVNVFLIVFRSYDIEALRKLEWKYIVVASIVTFVPALAFLFVRNDDKGPMYGSVTLWCAVAPSWVLIRIVCYYVPIWTMILITIVLYCLVGIEIVKRRRALQSITSDSVPLDDTMRPAGAASETWSEDADTQNYYSSNTTPTSPKDGTADELKHTHAHARFSPWPRLHPHPHPHPPTQPLPPSSTSASYSKSSTPAAILPPMTTRPHHSQTQEQPPTTPRLQPIKSSLSFRQYILMPLFFFLALLSVWVAPTTNRVAAFANPSFSSYPLLLVVGATGSLRGFWNGIVFVTIGVKSRSTRRRQEQRRWAVDDERGGGVLR
ncbi:hypothetical protein B0T26DRAFT_750060 [Lasiosphaeria miniovina]|uniref:G-protein coupled receptors family 2 profile 2 domain-containing protein n=1 Tax=Lasiosphaeria miniovina TaxID=1954250 RepID=A0AA40E2M2_9PEZI|nr:uncharacterized protein B0T26DRAFT_750060 [Lasiosphaeria miniovina]KAK0722692.1 hypothetical protein B0T26DRAFT_750060 [Lasiosphaeria miniovina]